MKTLKLFTLMMCLCFVSSLQAQTTDAISSRDESSVISLKQALDLSFESSQVNNLNAENVEIREEITRVIETSSTPKKECTANCNAGVQAARVMSTLFGKVIPAQTFQQWKPRSLKAVKAFNQKYGKDETIIGMVPGTHRAGTIDKKGVHILVFPPAFHDTKEFILVKNNGSQAQGDYTVCSSRNGGSMTNEYEISFPKDDLNGTRSVSVEGAKGKVTVVVIENVTGSGPLKYVVTDATDGQ